MGGHSTRAHCPRASHIKPGPVGRDFGGSSRPCWQRPQFLPYISSTYHKMAAVQSCQSWWELGQVAHAAPLGTMRSSNPRGMSRALRFRTIPRFAARIWRVTTVDGCCCRWIVFSRSSFVENSGSMSHLEALS